MRVVDDMRGGPLGPSYTQHAFILPLLPHSLSLLVTPLSLLASTPSHDSWLFLLAISATPSPHQSPIHQFVYYSRMSDTDVIARLYPALSQDENYALDIINMEKNKPRCKPQQATRNPLPAPRGEYHRSARETTAPPNGKDDSLK